MKEFYAKIKKTDDNIVVGDLTVYGVIQSIDGNKYTNHNEQVVYNKPKKVTVTLTEFKMTGKEDDEHVESYVANPELGFILMQNDSLILRKNRDFKVVPGQLVATPMTFLLLTNSLYYACLPADGLVFFASGDVSPEYTYDVRYANVLTTEQAKTLLKEYPRHIIYPVNYIKDKIKHTVSEADVSNIFQVKL